MPYYSKSVFDETYPATTLVNYITTVIPKAQREVETLLVPNICGP